MPSLGLGIGLGRGGMVRRRAFNPASVGTVALWDKADSLNAADGTIIDSLTDSSGNGHAATQSTAARKPIFKEGIFGIKPGIRFVDDYLRNASLTLDLSAFTLFLVFRETTATLAGGAFVITPSSGNDFESTDGLCINTGNSGDDSYVQAAGLVLASSNGKPTPARVRAVRVAGGTATYYDNGNLVATDASIGLAGMSGGGYIIGTRFSGAPNTDYLKGDFAECIVFSEALDAEARRAVESYLLTKYSIGPVSVFSPVPYQTFQRDASDLADIPVSGTYTGSPAAIEARFAGGEWAVIDEAPTGGIFSGVLAGQSAGQGVLEVRFVGSDSSAKVAFVGIGDVFVTAGQSNSLGLGFNNQTFSHPTLKASKFTTGWDRLADPYDGFAGSYWPLLATHIMASTGVPVAFISTGQNGSTIQQWLDGFYVSAQTRVSAAVGSGAGKVRVWLWHQGETDALQGTNQATYNARLDTLVASVAADYGVKLMPCKFQNCTAITDSAENLIRAAIGEAWADNANVLPGPDLSDLVSDDDYHLQSDASLATAAARWFAALEEALWIPSADIWSDSAQWDDTSNWTD